MVSFNSDINQIIKPLNVINIINILNILIKYVNKI